jgi:hypothetical protein
MLARASPSSEEARVAAVEPAEEWSGLKAAVVVVAGRRQ